MWIAMKSGYPHVDTPRLLQNDSLIEEKTMPKMDLTGQRFGRLVVLREAEDRISEGGSKHRQWECQCDCGNKVIVLQTSLRTGATRSCGCSKNVYGKADLTGLRKGRLRVIGTDDEVIKGSTIWNCQCDCGNTKTYTTKALLHSKVCSCGCVHRENGHKRIAENTVGIYKNTCITRIKKNSIAKNNNSGVTGVRKASDSNSWIAEITVQKKRIYLGSFRSYTDAVQARKEAEKQYFKPLIEEYEKGNGVNE